MTRILRIVSTALITAGLVVALDVGLTLAWEEPLSNLYAGYQQNQAEDELKDLERAFPDAGDFDAAAGAANLTERVAILANRFEDSPTVEAGQAIGRIEIPAIGVEENVIEGTDTASLQKGPGHYT